MSPAPPERAKDITSLIKVVRDNGFPYPSLPYQDGEGNTDDPDFVWSLADNVKGIVWEARKDDVLLAYNTDVETPYDVVLDSAADGLLRTGDVTYEALAADHMAIFGPLRLEGFRGADGDYPLHYHAYSEFGYQVMLYAVLRFQSVA
jgi:hypothetical protein